MSYVVLARKYRPMRFADMVGQEHIGRTLGNAITQQRVHHAYLFSGARGLGKTTTARIFAKGLVCEQGPTPTPCNVCSECVAVSESRSVDVMEIDGASNNSVDNIRNLREQVNYLPQTARRKVYIIDEVHMLTTSAFNALLKTLEEPPPHVNFVFATTEPQKVLPTILSRVNRLDFKRVSPGQLVGHLRSILDSEGLSVDEGGLRIVARAGGGSVRDALTLLDQVIAFAEDANAVGEDEVRRLLGQADQAAVQELVGAILSRDPTATMQRFDALVTGGNDLSVLSLQVLEYLRDLTVVKVCRSPDVLPDATEAEVEQLRAQVEPVEASHLSQLFDRFSRVIDRLPQSRSQRLLVEMGLLDLACAEPVMPLGDLVEQLQALGRGGPAPGGPAGRGGAPRGRSQGGAGASGRGRPRGASAAGAEPPPRFEGAAGGSGAAPPRFEGAAGGSGAAPPRFEGGSPRMEPVPPSPRPESGASTAPAGPAAASVAEAEFVPQMPSFASGAGPAKARPEPGPSQAASVAEAEFVPQMPSFEEPASVPPQSFTPTSTPSFGPSSESAAAPSFTPSSESGPAPSFTPSSEPSFTPSSESGPAPSFTPSSEPSSEGRPEPSFTPTSAPSFVPTSEPSFTPTSAPSFVPTSEPSFGGPSATVEAPTDPGGVAVASAAPTSPPSPAPGSNSTFTDKLWSMAREGGVMKEGEPEEPAPPWSPAGNGPSANGSPPVNGATAQGGAQAPSDTAPVVRMGAGPCLPPPPSADAIAWETITPFESWEQLVARIREGDEFLAAVLGELGLVALTGGALRLAAPRGSFAHTELNRHPQMRAQLEQATRDHFGAPFTVELAEGEPMLPELPSLVLVAEKRRAEHRAQVEAEAQQNPGIQSLLRTFHAQLVGTKPLHEP